MQTFLPYPDFQKTALVLDRQRLGKQRIETLQILRTLLGHTSGWSHHPAVKMWKGYEASLYLYGLYICDEWIKRGYKDNCKLRIKALYKDIKPNWHYPTPRWLNGPIHTSHRAALLAKKYEYYSQFNWAESPEIKYFWPKT